MGTKYGAEGMLGVWLLVLEQLQFKKVFSRGEEEVVVAVHDPVFIWKCHSSFSVEKIRKEPEQKEKDLVEGY